MQLRNMMMSAIFTAFMIISSYIVVPIGPVPHTLQTLVVILSGFLLGPKWGPISMVTWILLGVLGLPVFNQGQAGAVMLVGPTGGFIIGFIVCSWLIGILTVRDIKSGYFKTFIYLLSGIMVTYIVGLVGFKLSFEYFLLKPMTWEKSVWIAIAPFLPFDIIKTVVATYLGVQIRKALLAAGLYVGTNK